MKRVAGSRWLWPIFLIMVGARLIIGNLVVAGESAGVITYSWPDRLEAYEFSVAATSDGGQDQLSKTIGVVWISDFGKNLIDCSDDRFRCLRWGPNVLATPRTTLHRGKIYFVGGIEFRVEKCIAEAQYMRSEECDVALISATCRNMRLEEEVCDPEHEVPRGVSAGPSFVRYFFYHHQYGVTAMGTGPIKSLSWSDDRKRALAGQFSLIGEFGLLMN